MITVSVDELYKKIVDLKNDGIEFVDLNILEFTPEDNIPNCLSFNAYDGEGGGLDYEDIEEVKVNAFYKYPGEFKYLE